jgi:hypothetical protein
MKFAGCSSPDRGRALYIEARKPPMARCPVRPENSYPRIDEFAWLMQSWTESLFKVN